MVHKYCTNKKGGGVAISISNNFKVLDKLCYSLDNILECVSVQVSTSHKKPIIISCLHRPPNGDIQTTIDVINNIYMNKQSNIFQCGDFNINLLNSHKHKGSKDFTESLLSLGLFPCIIRPSQITSHSATLIDNIFTNRTSSQLKCGLINDISDHLPFFVIINNFIRRHEINKYMYCRKNNNLLFSSFNKKISEINWSSVYESKNDSYNNFMNIVCKVYDECCPVKKINK